MEELISNDDKLQAAMFRWLRKKLSVEAISEIAEVPVQTIEAFDQLKRDLVLRNAFDQYEVDTQPTRSIDRAKIRAGALPSELGEAMVKYTDAAGALAIARSNDESNSVKDACEQAMAQALISVCAEMAKL